MQLKILKVADAGDLQNERVIIKVLEDCQISWYLIFDNTYNADGTLSNLWRHLYIFPQREVKAGDFKWLYTMDYDDVLGVAMYKIGEKRVPVFYSGMLSGAHTY